MNRPRLIVLLLALITLVLYLPVGWHDFIVYDDGDYVSQNKVVSAGLTWDGVKWAFDSWHSSNWHPLTWLSHMLDCQLFGLNPGPQHMVNVLLHAANATLLFVLLLRMTSRLWPSAMVAALFAWHPLHVESVAWIAERKDVLSTFFGLLALLAYVRYVQEKNRRSFWVAVLLFACSLMSKPMLVTLPFVMALLDFWPLERVLSLGFGVQGRQAAESAMPRVKLWSLVFEKWPFFLLTLGSCVVTYFAQRAHSVIPLEQFPLSLRLGNAVLSYGNYLLEMIWPVNLAIIYPLPKELGWGWVEVAAVVLGSISVGIWMARRKAPYLVVGWCWFLGTLVPVIGLVQVGTAAMADRYSYVPLIGIFIAVVFGLNELGVRYRMKPALGALAGITLVGCVGLTERQLSFWRDDYSLFGHAVAVTRDNSAAHINYGIALENAGRDEEAQAEYHKALEIDPRNGEPYVDIGIYLDKQGKNDEAMGYYAQALKIWPESPIAQMDMGGLLAKLGRFDEAMQHYEAAAKYNPADVRPHYLMGKARLRQGRSAEAVTNFHEALQLDGMDYQSLLWLARVRAADEDASVRDGKEAVMAAERADLLTGNSDPATMDVLAMAYAETGRFDEAIQVDEAAIKIAEAAKASDAVATMRGQVELYKAGKAYREDFKLPGK